MKKVLVVDDDEHVREALKHFLEIRLRSAGMEHGHSIEVAADGMEALAMIDNGLAADVIISDVSMPVMNGLILLEEVRSRGLETPFLIHSSGTLYKDERDVMKMRSAIYFSKDDDTMRLCDKVISLLQTPTSTHGN